jgi:hypothetical protein
LVQNREQIGPFTRLQCKRQTNWETAYLWHRLLSL